MYLLNTSPAVWILSEQRHKHPIILTLSLFWGAWPRQFILLKCPENLRYITTDVIEQFFHHIYPLLIIHNKSPTVNEKKCSNLPKWQTPTMINFKIMRIPLYSSSSALEPLLSAVQPLALNSSCIGGRGPMLLSLQCSHLCVLSIY